MPRTLRSAAHSCGRGVRFRLAFTATGTRLAIRSGRRQRRRLRLFGFGLGAPPAAGRLCGRLLLLLDGRRGRSRLLGPPLADPGLLAHLAAEVVKPRLPHLAMPDDIHLVYSRRVDQERALHAHPVGDAAHREVAAQAAPGDPDDQALEDLDALPGPLDDLGVDAD